jgi:dienelactone hydrolase
MMRTALVSLLAIMLLSACQPTGDVTSRSDQRLSNFIVPALDVDGLSANAKPINLRLSAGFPEGDGPFPVVIILHGSGNMSGRDRALGEQLEEQGIAWLGVQTFDSRGLSNAAYLSRLARATVFDQISDAYVALEFAAAHPLLDADRAALTGFSLGGISVIAAASGTRAGLQSDRNFSYFLNQYGGCIVLNEVSTPGIRLDHIWGGQDASTPRDDCMSMFSHYSSRGIRGSYRVVESAAHGWFINRPSRSANSFQDCRISISGDVARIRAGADLQSISQGTDQQLMQAFFEKCSRDIPYELRRDATAEELAVHLLVSNLR